jgi:hypothetical protein
LRPENARLVDTHSWVSHHLTRPTVALGQ